MDPVHPLRQPQPPAAAPGAAQQAAQERASDDFRDAGWVPKIIVLAIGLGGILAGLGLLVAALSDTSYMAKSDVPRWIGFAASLMFLLPGIACIGLFLYGIGLPLSTFSGFVGGLLAFAMVAMLLAIFHWGAFFALPDSWRGTWIGPLGPRDFARIIVVAFDFLALALIAGAIWLVPKTLRREQLKQPPAWVIISVFVGPFALALALQFAGAYDWIEQTLPQKFPSLARKSPESPTKPEPPARPLAHYLGTWVNPRLDRNSVHRVEIRSEAGSVFVRAWWTCMPKDCDRGEARAQVIAPRPGSELIAALKAELRDHKGDILSIAIVPSGDGLVTNEATHSGGKVISGAAKLRRKK